MTPQGVALPLVFQTFESEDGTPLASLPTSLCTETDERYVLWRDVQDAFDGILHVSTMFETTVLFTIDGDGEL